MMGISPLVSVTHHFDGPLIIQNFKAKNKHAATRRESYVYVSFKTDAARLHDC